MRTRELRDRLQNTADLARRVEALEAAVAELRKHLQPVRKAAPKQTEK